jgi:hypothetical protein
MGAVAYIEISSQTGKNLQVGTRLILKCLFYSFNVFPVFETGIRAARNSLPSMPDAYKKLVAKLEVSSSPVSNKGNDMRVMRAG